jgi:hypothetical protein
MENDTEAVAAMTGLDGRKWANRTLKVRVASNIRRTHARTAESGASLMRYGTILIAMLIATGVVLVLLVAQAVHSWL